MKLNTIIICIINLIAAGTIYAQSSTTILPYESSGYRYIIQQPSQTPPAGFEQPSFNDSSWNIGQAGFGFNTTFCPVPTPLHTSWSANTRLLLRKIVNIPNGVRNIKLHVSVDNDIEKIYFNGTQIVSSTLHDNCPTLNQSVFTVPQNLVQTGNNLIAYQVSDRGHETFFDSKVTGNLGSTFLDFDGDGKTDFSVVRESTWYNLLSSSNNSTYQSQVLGNPIFNHLTPGDYDGDGKTDVAVWRRLNGDWLRFNSSNNTFSQITFGQRGDEPVARDYDGDGKTDLAVVRRTAELT